MAKKSTTSISTRTADTTPAAESQVVDDHTQRLVALKDRRSLFDDLQEDVAKYTIPMRQDWHEDAQQGQKHGQHMWDGTPQGAVNIFTNGMYGNVVSPALPWFMILTGDTMLDDIPSVKEWTQETTKAISRALYRSNFYREMLPFIADWGTIGTATLYSELDEASQRIAFNCIHPKQVYIATDRFGFVDTVFREYKISLRNAVAQFGEDGISEMHQRMYKETPFREIKILHAAYPRIDYDHTRKDVKNKPVASVWIDMEHDKVFRVSGFDDFPYAVGRYAVNSGEDYGRSPAMESLPDIKSLHKISKDLLQASDMRVNPMINAHVSQKGQVRIGSKRINYFERPENRLHAADVGGDYFVGVDREQRKQENIREAFHVNFFLMLQNAERGMTATEILERQSEKAIVLAPAVGRLTFEVLDKIISRVFAIELAAGRIETPPDPILERGSTVEVDYLGPLAQVQARLFENRGLVNALEVVAPLAQQGLWPEIIDNWNADEISDVISDSYNVPQRVIRSTQEVLELRQSRAAAMAAQQQQMNAESTAKALKDAGAANEKFDGALQDVAEDAIGS
jgi:hypothetical protein